MAGTVLDIESIIHPDKTCSKCRAVKSLDQFYADRHGKDGKMSYCKSCRGQQTAAWQKNNPEKARKIKERHKENNPKAYSLYYKKHREKNPGKAALDHANRRANMEKATVVLTPEDKEKIKQLYWLAKDLEIISGQKYNVDHIIPISRGGKHHWSNLQILPKDINLKKWAN